MCRTVCLLLACLLLIQRVTVAQDDAGSLGADRIIITGSNIPTADEVGPAPVDIIDSSTRDTTGQEDTESLLTRAVPAISSSSGGGGGNNLGQSNADVNVDATLGGSSVAIHGLPTLVLLDGRRISDAAAQAIGGLAFTDVNLFPPALIKRIEVLKDGASAIYGTEAVGGVVNVMLDHEFEGVEFSTRYGFTEAADIHNERYSALFGAGDDKTHIVLAATYVEQDPIYDRQRQYAYPTYGTTTYPGIIRFDTANSAFINPFNPYGTARSSPRSIPP